MPRRSGFNRTVSIAPTWFFLDEPVIGWKCHWMRNSEDEIVVGWKCLGWKCHWMKSCLDESVIGWNRVWMKVSLDEIVFGWKCHWMKSILDESVFHQWDTWRTEIKTSRNMSLWTILWQMWQIYNRIYVTFCRDFAHISTSRLTSAL